ncbi:hypothetical protein [Pyrobaculum neutrophilum]|uniref:Uncharacterized protein n=1 Tax=Pyrobaculum neutrophilum (strain DSM 2338 / JCM 9278 / NBRC 100436 / V24Sta) TaxID=444157 RepID=B1YCR8_PYRNV|nr:hypothetical protein [Pyrobaculum neutrophilum]ACB39581.1 conserved hypothetical protein [Pyrobaculum neutrophilum V24Sta]
MIQIVDHTTGVHTLGEIDALISPACGSPPPAPRRISFTAVAKAVRSIYGVDIRPALEDQADLGLERLDPVLLYGQLPLEHAWIAKALPHCSVAASCAAPRPDPVTAALSLMSHGVGKIAVDLRGGFERYGVLVAQHAAELGAEVQLIVAVPLRLHGDLVFHSSVPPHLRERYIRAAGDVSVQRGPVELREWRPQATTHAECEKPRFTDALAKIAEILGVGEGVLEDLAAQSVLSHSYVLDLLTPLQLGYLAKWGLVRQLPGGWGATPKFLYLYGLYRRG